MSSYLSPGTVLGDGKYLLGKKLGSGSHGDVYLGKDLNSEEEVAIKLESWNCEQLFLTHEFQVYKTLEGGEGFPMARWYAEEQKHNYMIMDLLGPSLDSLFAKSGNKFGIKTVLLLAEQLLQRVEHLHSRGFIHRSIKPENFSVGKENPSKVYMIDFGNSKRYKNKSGEHIKCKVYEELGLANCHSRHQSLAALQRMERSRRDDMESLGYMLIYFLKGSLPWDNVMHDPVALKNVKMGTSVNVLCEGCPEAFETYMTYVRNLTFEQAPDYSFLRQVFKTLSDDLNLAHDGQFDWIQSETKEQTNEAFSFKDNATIRLQER